MRARTTLAIDRDRAACSRGAVEQPTDTGATGVGTSDPVVDDVDDQSIAVHVDLNDRLRPPRVLRGVRERLGDHEVGRGFDRGRNRRSGSAPI